MPQLTYYLAQSESDNSDHIRESTPQGVENAKKIRSRERFFDTVEVSVDLDVPMLLSMLNGADLPLQVWEIL